MRESQFFLQLKLYKNFVTLFFFVSSLFWFFHNKMLEIDLSRMSLDSFTLVFSYIADSDTGTYACGLKVDKNLTYIDVFTLAVVPEKPHVIVDIGTELIIVCQEQFLKKVANCSTTKMTW